MFVILFVGNCRVSSEVKDSSHLFGRLVEIIVSVVVEFNGDETVDSTVVEFQGAVSFVVEFQDVDHTIVVDVEFKGIEDVASFKIDVADDISVT